jgi:polygalacturonase
MHKLSNISTQRNIIKLLFMLSKAFTNAFQAACASKGRSSLLVPPGTYQLGPIKFGGPCPCSHITFDIKGTLVAPPDVKAFPGPAWIEFDALHELVVEGGGIIDGQGQSAWTQTCNNKAIVCLCVLYVYMEMGLHMF